MASPSQAEIESYTDKLADLVNQDLTGYLAETSGATIASLWDLVNASSEQAAKNALLAPSLAVDAHSLPENLSVALQSILSRPRYSQWASALNALVTGTDGGSNASLQAYLATLTAKIHPLAAEALRAGLGQGAFTASGGNVPSVFPPNYQSRAPAKCYTGADGALVDATTAAGNATTADVTIWGTNGHSVYIGSPYKFNQVVFGLSTLANVTGAPTITYWNGTTWTAVAGLTDNSAGLTKNDTIKWTLPTDWERSYKDAGGTVLTEKTRLYWVKLTRTAVTLGTPPVGSTIRLIPALVPYGTGSLHLGVDQPPLAICRVTGVNTLVVEYPNGLSAFALDLTRFCEGDTIKLRALTPLTTLTVTLAYVNDAGADASAAQSGWTTPAALDLKTIVLTASDLLRSVKTTSSCSTAGTAGAFEVIAQEKRAITH